MQGYRRYKINQFASSPEAEIAAVLRQFYVEVQNTDEEPYSDIDELLPSSLRQSRCLLTSVTFSASYQPASASVLGGARALPFPDLTVDEINSIRYFAEVEEVPAVELAKQVTWCSSLQFGRNLQLTGTNCAFNIIM